MKTIVTGGCGFIGSHLAERLINDGHDVLAIDNLSTGRLMNTEHLKSNQRFRVAEYDITEYDNIKPLFKNVDWVFHLAALADIIPSIEQPLKYHNANVNGTISVLEASRNAGVKRFIYAASSSSD